MSLAEPLPQKSLGSSADAFLAIVGKKQGNIKGESEVPGHVGDIGVIAWRWGVKATAAHGSTSATGRRVYDLLEVDKLVDRSTTALLSALAYNEEIKSATLSLRKSGSDGGNFLRIKLEKARVVASQIHSSPNGGLYETIGIAYTKIDVEYNQQSGSGGLGGGMLFSDDWNTAA